MSNLPIPQNEEKRVAKLRSYGILDTSPEAQFDDLTKLAARICDVPICLISLIDENRQWFKSKVGLDAPETSRDISFCQYAIMDQNVLEVEDSLSDERFAQNPLVTGDPNIRFYSGAPLVDDEGLPMGTLCVIDVEPKKLNKDQRDSLREIANTVMRMIRLRKINEEREEYFKLFDLSKDLLCIGGLHGYYKNLNPAFTEVLGWSKEEMLSKPFLELVHPDDSLATIKEFEKLAEGEVMNGFINRYRTKSGDYKWLSWTCQPSLESEQLFAVAHDVTELKKANEAALKSVKAKDIFLANMSHEIRTPLNAIIGFTDLLDGTNMSEEQSKFVKTIGIASDNLLMLINNVLDLSKIESGNLELEQEDISIKDVMNNVIRLNAQKAKEKNLKLVSSVDHELPDFVIGDSARLMQILLNLTSNAVKFTHAGQIELKAFSENISEDEVMVNFSVKDTGIGIDPDNVERMFDRFTQAESSTTRKYGGTGLGLNIVKRLIELHNGEIAVKSIPGEGTEFIFSIKYPLSKSMVNTEKSNVQDKFAEAALDGVRILLVEDNEHNQILATTYLKKNKAEVDLAQNGREAVELALENDYDCIIMDLQMPEMNGFEATKKIRNELKLDIPILACTAHSLVGEKNKSLQIGMNDYVTKPYSEFDLVQTILKHVKGIEFNGSPSENNEEEFDDVIGILKSLEKELGSEFVEAMLNVFNKRTPKDIKDINAHMMNKDFDALRKKAHLIAGSCGSLRFFNGHKLAKKVEKSVSENSIHNIKFEVKDLIDYLERTLEIFKNEFQS